MEVNAISRSTCRTQASASSFSFKGQVQLTTTQPQQDTLELSDKGKALSQGLMGKLNALEHSNSPETKPMFLKGVVQKMTGVKLRDVDIDSSQITRTSASLDATSVTAQTSPGSASLTYEHLQAQSSSYNLSVQGSATSKSGAAMGFSLQIDMSRLAASYEKYSWSATQESASGLDTAA